MQTRTCKGSDLMLRLEGRGEARAYLSLPRGGRGPGVLVLHEIAGVNYHIRGVCDYFAELGYVALAPNMFWRIAQDHEGDYGHESASVSVALHDRSPDVEARGDLAAIVAVFRGNAALSGGVAAIGYCYGGRIAYLAAADGLVQAAACLYPTYLEKVLDRADDVKCPVSIHLPEFDHLVSPEARRKIEAYGNRTGVELFRYPGAKHAFDSDSRRETYDRWASQTANSRIIRAFQQALGPA